MTNAKADKPFPASRLFRFASALAFAVSLAACTSVPGSAVMYPVVQTSTVGSPVNVMVATTRKRSETDRRGFTSDRNLGLSFEAYTVSVPPNHVAGEVEWPTTLPGNPASSFVVTRSQPLDQASFNHDVVQDAKGTGEVIVFVHGYNTSYQEAVFRAAQLKHDNRFPEAMAAFVWPSMASVTEYFADREGATYSRDYLEKTLDGLARAPGVRHINIIAHSMGNWLLMETLRQAKLRGKSAFLSKLGEVALMSPDIDIYVLHTQLDVIGKLNPPLTIAVSHDDQALGASQWLAGNVPRAGNVLLDDDKEVREAIAKYGLRIIDMSDARSADSINHSKFVDLLPALNQMVRTESLQRSNLLARTGLFAVNAASGLLQTPLQAIARAGER